MWHDIQLSKGPLNKDRKIEVEINGKMEKLTYRTAPCNGIKYCSFEGCNYIASVREKRPCSHHKSPLSKTSSCPVELVYIYPEDSNDNCRRIGGLIRCPKESVENLHNHPMPPPSAIAQCIKKKISTAVQLNPTLKPSDIACGKGVGLVPSAVDSASSHLGRVSREVMKAKQALGITDTKWNPSEFECVANEIDANDKALSATSDKRIQCYEKYGRPYLVSADIEEGIKYIFTMTPLMMKVANSAEFMQCDITYDETRE